MSEYKLSSKQIQLNWNTFRDIVNEISPVRRLEMNIMYDELEERIVMAPASTIDYFHNAIPGGYIDHILRVYENTLKCYDLWKSSGMIVDNFSLEELSFAAIHHDLGKIGMPGEGRELYQTNKSEWHRKNQGKVYQMNPNLVHMESTDRTFYLLNHYRIPYSENEQLGIQLTDGMYNETNKPYLVAYELEKKLRNTMGMILHHADIMAARYEFEQWSLTTGKFELYNSTKKPQKQLETKTPITQTPNKQHLDLFAKVFENMGE
jgi:hypothetical protein